ncbi:MAG: hypothetical protein ACKO96_06840, partial [Flammeovirgaceae bacterium]
GDGEFIQRCESLKKYFRGEVQTIDGETLSLSNLVGNGSMKNHNSTIMGIIRQLPGAVPDTRMNRVLFPVSCWDGEKFAVSGAGEISLKDESANISVDSPGIYIHAGSGRIPDKLFVSAAINGAFLEHICAEHATVLSPDLNSPQVTKLCEHLGLSEIEYLVDDIAPKQQSNIRYIVNELTTQPL